MRRSLVLLAATAMALLHGAVVEPDAASAASLSLQQLGSVQRGQQFDVGVKIDLGPSESLFAFNVNVLYDSVVYDVVSVQFGDPSLVPSNQLELTGPSLFTQSVGNYPGNLNLFDWSHDSPAAIESLQESSFRLATVRFEADAGASSGDSFDVYACPACLNDPSGAALPVESLQGFTVSAVAGGIGGGGSDHMPEPSSALLFGVGFGVAALLRRRR